MTATFFTNHGIIYYFKSLQRFKFQFVFLDDAVVPVSLNVES